MNVCCRLCTPRSRCFCVSFAELCTVSVLPTVRRPRGFIKFHKFLWQISSPQYYLFYYSTVHCSMVCRSLLITSRLRHVATCAGVHSPVARYELMVDRVVRSRCKHMTHDYDVTCHVVSTHLPPMVKKSLDVWYIPSINVLTK